MRKRELEVRRGVSTGGVARRHGELGSVSYCALKTMVERAGTETDGPETVLPEISSR